MRKILNKLVIGISALGMLAAFPVATLANENHNGDANWASKPSGMSDHEWQYYLAWRGGYSYHYPEGGTSDDHRGDRNHRGHRHLGGHHRHGNGGHRGNNDHK